MMQLPWAIFITTWFANINDLIRGEWFYYSTTGIIVANIYGLLALTAIILTYKERIKLLANNITLDSKDTKNETKKTNI